MGNVTSVCIHLCLCCLALASSFAFAGEGEAPDLAGKWQLSWEARLGTETGTMHLEQADSNLTGSYQGHFSSSKLSGTVQDKNITLNLYFQGAHPFAMVFTGTVDGDKMTGKFSVGGAKDGYDAYGENAHPTNYSWTAVRQLNQTQSHGGQQNQPNRK
jgi:hypothetical protein